MSSDAPRGYLCDADPTTAVEKLAQLAVIGRRLRGRTKQAAPALWDRLSQLAQDNPAVAATLQRLQQAGQSAGQWAQTNPGAASTLGGAGIGALAGGLSSLGRPRRERRPLRSALTGALAGGALGGGGYLAARNLQPAPRTSTPVPLPSADEISRLSQRSLPTQALQGGQNFLGSYAQNHPWLATLLGLDVGSQSLGTAAALTGTPSTRLSHIRSGIDRMLAGKNLDADYEQVLKRMRGNPQLAERVFRRLRTGNAYRFTIPGGKDAPLRAFTMSPRMGAEITNELGGGMLRRGGTGAMADLLRRLGLRIPQGVGTGLNPAGAPVRTPPQGPWWQRAFTRGTNAVEGAARTGASLDNPLLRQPRSAWTRALARGGPRAALYLGVPALQHYLQQSGQETQNLQKLEELARQLGGVNRN